MNWSECEKEIAKILKAAIEKHYDPYEHSGPQLDCGVLIAEVESEIASWIDTNFGLESDPNLPPGVKHHHEEPLGSSRD